MRFTLPGLVRVDFEVEGDTWDEEDGNEEREDFEENEGDEEGTRNLHAYTLSSAGAAAIFRLFACRPHPISCITLLVDGTSRPQMSHRVLDMPCKLQVAPRWVRDSAGILRYSKVLHAPLRFC